MQAVILSAGKGTRLHPVTATRSKAMAPIAGKPIVHRVMDTLIVNGITAFVLVVSPKDTEIRRYFEDNCPANVDVTFVNQSERLGMAHALGLAATEISGPFILSACDNLVPETFVGELLTRFNSQECAAVLSLKPVAQERIPSVGIVDVVDNGRVRRIVEKPTIEEAPSNIGSMPLYLFSERLLDYLPNVEPSERGEYELQDAIQMLIEDDQSVHGLFTETRLQLTNTDDLLKLNRHYLALEEGQPKAPESIGPGSILHSPIRIEAGVVVGNDCSIGPNVVLEQGCHIGDRVVLDNVMVLRGCRLEKDQNIKGQVVV